MMTADKDISSTDTLTAATSPLRVLLAAGGTGGHVYPAIAIADAIRVNNPGADILFVGTKDRMEWETVPKLGYNIKSVWISGFHRRLTPQNLLFPLKLITSLFQSLKILLSFKPDIVVACGGFAAGPVGWVASKMGIPLVIQEQNSFPGVTNRLLAKHAELIFTAFDDAKEYFPDKNVELAGNPVRKQLELTTRENALNTFGFDAERPVLLVLGGSGGARALNETMKLHLDTLHHELGLQIIWQCGKNYIEQLEKEINTEEYPNLRMLSFIDDMPSAYGASDLVITRAGASTCSELMLLGQPAILVPSPNVAGDHQAKNARAMVNTDAAGLLEEDKLDEEFTEAIKELIFNKDELERMSRAMRFLAKPDAANSIAKKITTLAKKEQQ